MNAQKWNISAQQINFLYIIYEFCKVLQNQIIRYPRAIMFMTNPSVDSPSETRVATLPIIPFYHNFIV